MNILVTGGAGFIGSHLVEKLSVEHAVTVLDDFSTGRIDNLTEINCRIVEDDVRVAHIDETYDLIFHAAAMVGQERCYRDEERTIDVNVRGTENIVNQAEDATLVFFSSSEVYRGVSLPMQEDSVSVELLNRKHSLPPYAYSKLKGEETVQQHGKSIIVRLFNTVGERQVGNYGMVVPRFIQQALRNEPLSVFGDGQQSRSFAYGKEVADALIALGMSQRAVGQTLNVGSANEITIMDLAEKVRKSAQSSSDIVFVPHEEVFGPDFEDVEQRVPDLTFLASFIGSVPSMSIDDIIEHCIAEQRTLLEVSV